MEMCEEIEFIARRAARPADDRWDDFAE